MTSPLRMCKSDMHPGVTLWHAMDVHCPDCVKTLQNMTGRQVMEAYRASSQEERWRLGVIYNSFEDKDPLLDWVEAVKKSGLTPPLVF